MSKARTLLIAVAAVLLLTAGCVPVPDWQPTPGPTPGPTPPQPTPPPSPPGPTPPQPTPPPSPPRPTPTPAPAPDDALVMGQDGLAQFVLDRQVLDLSVGDIEQVLGAASQLAGQTDTCGLAVWESDGIAATTDSDQAVVALVTDRPDVVSTGGIRVGDSLDDVIDAHGEQALQRFEQPPTPSGGMLVAVADEAGATESAMHLAYELDVDARVARIRGGFAPYSLYAEYCSDDASRSTSAGWPLQ